MTGPKSGAGDENAPVLTAASAAGRRGNVRSARAIARVLSLPDDERILLGVADGVGDPPSAEAQATEALTRLEQAGARAPRETQPAGVLEAAYADAADAVAGLKALPGSVPGSGAGMTAAIVSRNAVTVAHLGRGAAFLRRGSELRRLTADHRWSAVTAQAAAESDVDPEATREFGRYAPLGAQGPGLPDITAPIPLQAGDVLLLCSEAVVRRLGARTIASVLEEYDGDEAAPELTDLTAQQEGVDGAAVALLRLPSRGLAVLPAAAGAGAPSIAATRTPRRMGVTLAVLMGAIVVGAAIAGALYYAANRRGNTQKSAATVATRVPAGSPAGAPAGAGVASPTPLAGGATARAVASTPATGTPAVASATATGSPTPIVVANLPSCDSGQPPCRYLAKSGDSLSLIAEKFNVSAACFTAANRNHEPVAPVPPVYRIGAGEEYAILTASGCAALASPTPAATPAASGVTPAAGTTGGSATASPAAPLESPTVRPACTPRPGASAPNPLC